MVVWRNIGTKLIGHKIHHHFQLFLRVIDFFNSRRLFIFHRLRDAVQNYKKFKQLFNILVNRFKNIMSQNIRFLLMKSLIGFEGRGPAIQYMPSKHHHRFRSKLFCLCESSTGYTNSFSIYETKNKNCSEHGLSHDICVDLMEPLLDMGYYLYTGNWYTAVSLAEFLSSRNTNITGTVCANQKILPAGVKQKFKKATLLLLGKIIFFVLAGMIKKHVILLRTEGLSKMITYTSKRNREHTMPELERDYNLHMGGVDLSDMRTYVFLAERKTVRWNKEVFFTLFGRLLLNSTSVMVIYQN